MNNTRNLIYRIIYLISHVTSFACCLVNSSLNLIYRIIYLINRITNWVCYLANISLNLIYHIINLACYLINIPLNLTYHIIYFISNLIFHLVYSICNILERVPIYFSFTSCNNLGKPKSTFNIALHLVYSWAGLTNCAFNLVLQIFTFTN
jgi:hypothetical protein